MPKIPWFAGGKDRGDQAQAIISELLKDLANDPNCQALAKVLLTSQTELRKKECSVPFILSRMNLEISRSLKKEGLNLTDEQSHKLKQLADLSSIRYGY